MAILGAVAIVGCGESESTVTASPTPLKCQVALAVSSPSIGPDGGTGAVAVTTTPECPWDVSTAANWLSGLSPASGQGSSTIEFRAAPNPLPSTRQGEIVVNDSRVAVSQQAAPCRFELRPNQLTIDAKGATQEVAVSTMTGCSWTSSADVGWISFTGSVNGNGPGTMRVNIAPNPGEEPRSGTIMIGGQRATVTQAGTGTPGPGTPGSGTPSPGCTYQVGPSSTAVAATGGTVTVAVSTANGCAWTASSGAAWVTVTSAGSGNGNGSAAFSVAANSGPARSGTFAVAGQTFTVTQAAAAAAPSCTYSIGSTTASIAASGESGTVAVSTTSNCSWTASSGAEWISITSGGSGTGNGSVGFSVAANTGGSRSGTLTIASQTFSVTQAAGAVSCSYSLGSSSASIAADGGSGSVGVSTGSSCTWTASSGAEWISITSGGSGTGNGSVAFNVAANTGGARSSTLSIAGHAFTVSQGAAAVSCSYSISPTSVEIKGAATGSITVSTTSGCTWTANSNTDWLTVTSGSSGSGNGSVSWSAEAPRGKNDRTSTITIAGQTFTVNQKN